MALSEQAQVALGVGCGNSGVGVEIAKALNMTKDTGNVGAANGATVTATEYTDASGTFHKTVLTLAATPLTLRDTEQGKGVKVYDFPEGFITVLGGHMEIAVTTTSVINGTLNASKTLSIGVGSTTQANGTLATTEQDIVNVGSTTSSATINVAGATGTCVNTTPKGFDGSATPVDAYLNIGVPTGTDIDADATVTVTGSITILWAYLGDA